MTDYHLGTYTSHLWLINSSDRYVGFCPTPVGLCHRGLLSYGLLS